MMSGSSGLSAGDSQGAELVIPSMTTLVLSVHLMPAGAVLEEGGDGQVGEQRCLGAPR